MLRINNVKINVSLDQDRYIKQKLSKLFNKDITSYKINKRSIDARHKPDVFYVYEIDITIPNEDKYLKLNDVSKVNLEEYTIPTCNMNSDVRPIIIGLGPAGLFCSYILAKAGLKPIIFERGKKIDERIKDVEEFWNNNKLNINSNIQFGEGGAGTFSDGKLNTMIKETLRQKFVFKTFVECGAPEEILYLNKPHIGTDVLRNVIKNMRNKIIELGGEIHYSSTLTSINIINNEIKSVVINNIDTYKTDNLVLAIGHSARDTFKMLNEYLTLIPKAFAVGVRVQHKQDLINNNQYGDAYKYLDNADYKLTYQTKDGRGVYSFCMCPGGFVVNSSSEENRLCINGMSNHDREEENANSAIVVTVSPSDFGNNIFDGMHFQEELENKAYIEGKGLIPISLYKDYKLNQISTSFGSIKPIFKGGFNFSNINNIFPEYINSSLKEAIDHFNNQIKGFNNDDVIIAAVEARTSSPIRILRDDNLESNIKGIYPCGEGAGYAGGITSASIDGIRVAEAIINKINK
ncbi:MAG: FAD-dependent oxidoreductase [Bacilli bacterium]|nr:FAD-dependent oxidoreductase [Bacilli bacterium]